MLLSNRNNSALDYSNSISYSFCSREMAGQFCSAKRKKRIPVHCWKALRKYYAVEHYLNVIQKSLRNGSSGGKINTCVMLEVVRVADLICEDVQDQSLFLSSICRQTR